jgi:TRAP transporter 4TM/12TM fusion protein
MSYEAIDKIAGEYIKFRTLDGWVSQAVKAILAAIPVVGCFFIMDCPFYLNWSILMEQYYGIIAAMILPMVFMLVPFSRKAPLDRVPWYDVVLALLSIVVFLYVGILYNKLLQNVGEVTPDRVVMGTIALALTLEASRRTINLFITIFALVFLVLPHLSFLLGDAFTAVRLPFAQQVNYLFLDTNGILSLMFGLIVTQILGFTLMGNLIQGGGGGAFITDFAMAAFGSVRGGPAKVSVVGSSLFGMISGSAIANVVVDGWMTIPTMIRTGYKPHVAAAIEAVASTGGQIMPPVMGVAAFAMAEIIGVPYYKVAIAAAIPAILYYTAIFFQVDMEAGKTDLKGLPRDQLPKMANVIRKIHYFLLP